MELRHLRYFVALAEELHFRRAAERLHISQPPLSQQIRALEVELGAELLKRNRRKVELTPAGQVFLGEARTVLAAADRAVAQVRRVARGEAGELSIGFVGSAMYGRLPEALREFRRARPELVLSLRELSTAAQLEALAAGTIDVGVCRPAHTEAGLRMEIVHREPVLAALPQEHPLARRRTVALAELSREAFVLLARREAPGLHATLTAALAAVGEAAQPVQEVAEIRTVLGLVSAGIGVSLVPASVATRERGGVVYRPLGGEGPRVELSLAWRYHDDSPALAAFLQTAREVLQEAPPGMDC